MDKNEQIKELKFKIIQLTDEELDEVAGGSFVCQDERCIYQNNCCVCPDDDE